MVCFLIASCKECFLACILAESIVWSEQDRQRSAYFSTPNRLKWSSALRPDGWKPLLSTICGHTSFSLLADIWRREWTRELNVRGEVAECTIDKPYQSSGVGGCGFKVWCWLWECFVRLVWFMGWLHLGSRALAIIAWCLCLILASHYSMSDYVGQYSLFLLRTFWTVVKKCQGLCPCHSIIAWGTCESEPKQALDVLRKEVCQPRINK